MILKMHGTAASVLKMEPHNILFGDVCVRDLPITKKIVIRAGKLAKEGTLESLVATCDHPGIGLDITQNADKVILDVELRPEVALGVVRTEIQLKVADFKKYTVGIPVISHIKGDYTIFLGSLFFGKVKAGASVTKQCVVTPLSVGDTLELVPNTQMPDLLEIHIQNRGKEALVTGTFTANAHKGVFEQAFVFKLTPHDGSLPQYLQIPAIAVSAGP